MKIQAAVVRKVGEPFKIEELELAPPQKGEVLVEVAAVGVCHSDWHLVTGATSHPLPCVAGHEGAGVVKEIGPGVTRVKPGDHVALNWAPSCGVCFYCTNGRPGLCEAYLDPIWAGTMMDGTTRLSRGSESVFHFSSLACFADHAVVPDVCCVPIDTNVPFAVTALIGCAVTTGVGAVLYTAMVEAGSSVAVFGAGGVGLSIIMGARAAGATRIIAVDRSPKKRSIVTECGATDFVPADGKSVEAIRKLTEGRGADYVFEAVGMPSVQEESYAAARRGGTVILAGIAPVGSSTNLPGALITREEKTIKGSYYGTSDAARDFPRFAEMYLKGELPLDKLISSTYPLQKINQAYEDMLSGTVARGIIEL